jgi:hypothetical protein
MDYNKISNFLEKFKKLIYQKEFIKDSVVNIISNEVSFKLKKDSIKIKNGVIYLEGSPILRNEVLMRKKNILSSIKKIIPESNFLDIK